jgi:hypothetical protein
MSEGAGDRVVRSQSGRPPAAEGQPAKGSSSGDRQGSRDWLCRLPAVSPPFAFKNGPGAAGAVQAVPLRAFLAGQFEVEDLAVGRDPVPVG